MAQQVFFTQLQGVLTRASGQLQYQWGVKVTLEYSKDDGSWAAERPELRECRDEREARARQDAAMDTIARYARDGAPRHARIAASELVRRPVGDWETVSIE